MSYEFASARKEHQGMGVLITELLWKPADVGGLYTKIYLQTASIFNLSSLLPPTTLGNLKQTNNNSKKKKNPSLLEKDFFKLLFLFCFADRFVMIQSTISYCLIHGSWFAYLHIKQYIKQTG